MKTVVLFGAGASFDAIPVIDEMTRHIPYLSERLKDPQVMSQVTRKNELSLFIKMLDDLSESLTKTKTPDISLRKFYKSGSDFHLWLKVFWLYLNIIQTGKRSDIGLSSTSKFREYSFVDKRYSTLISDYLIDEDDDFSFLTWNYDIQFELAYMEMFSLKSFDSLFQKLTCFPSIHPVNHDDHKLIHLNGTSMFFESKSNEDYKTELSIQNFETGLRVSECLNNHLWVLDGMHNVAFSISNTLRFSFTYDAIKLAKLKEQISCTMHGCKKLVIIGYSFPKANHKIDALIFNQLSPEADILIQNPISVAYKLKQFGIDKRRITEITDSAHMGEFIVE